MPHSADAIAILASVCIDPVLIAARKNGLRLIIVLSNFNPDYGGARAYLHWLGIDLASALAQRRSFCRPCLDWSERRPHIAGSLGARLADRCLELDWVRRQKDSRALTITRRGSEGFRDLLGIRLAATGEALQLYGLGRRSCW